MIRRALAHFRDVAPKKMGVFNWSTDRFSINQMTVYG